MEGFLAGRLHCICIFWAEHVFVAGGGGNVIGGYACVRERKEM